jgi:proline dehydrogenase
VSIKQSLVYRFAKRWIAGKELEEALKAAQETNEKGMRSILNYLGEDVSDPAVVERNYQEYLKIQNITSERGMKACISLKPTQFGTEAAQRIRSLAEEGEKLNQDVWIDMENSASTSKTLEIYLDVLRSYRNVGVALQAYLKRSEQDLVQILDAGGRVRLCKGAYRESPEIVFKSREEINENFTKLLNILFERGNDFAVATHDSKLIDDARKLADSHHVVFEFEMLKGIRNELKEELVASGYRVSDYLPYGSQWYNYSMRRVTEHPSNVWLLARSLL